jgi:uncharacterized membrane protein
MLMIDFENTIHIDRPTEEVFAFIADFENIPKWNYYVMSVKKTSNGPVGEGTRYHQIRKTDQQDFEITEYISGKRITVKTLPGSTPKFERRFDFEAVNGGVKIVDSWKLDTGRNPLIEKLGAFAIKSAVKENLGKLKDLLEAGQTQLQDGRTVTV